ncbi:hypothetical protein [Brevifollis gellanilyticus]|uniref:Uncharacterized protein n=1 Tax=Brevifollis gellanilyticus TaxID=748831 RepID=A0A512M3S0_9BACT|nr:hypothetical protein [Brevifollis gellanilyticus]GEP41387.1 hypothetical protein BGE01nite_06780 [Brevifollis gellanilyticus]
MTANDVDSFERAGAQIHQLHIEISLLSKSKPDNPINKFKLTFINEVLGAANVLLVGEFKPFSEFDLFDSDELPSNSDVVMILSQYIDAFEAFRCAHIYEVKYDGWHWATSDKSSIKTRPPTRYRKNENEKKANR